MCLPLLMAARLCICVGVWFFLYVYVLFSVTTLPSAGLLLPPYIISPKDLQISAATFD